YRTMSCQQFEALTIDAIDQSVKCIAQARCVLRHHIQHRLDVRRRAGDHSQNLARRRLLLQSFSKLTVTSIELIEQPHILDSYHCLVSESLKQLNVLL